MADITGTAGSDTLNGTALNDAISGLAGSDLIQAGDGDDTLYGNTGLAPEDSPDSLYGELGSDTLFGFGGDLLVGGDGADTIYIGADGLQLWHVTAMGGDGDDVIKNNFEIPALGYFDSTAIQSTFDGGAGNDTLWCIAHESLFIGGDGDDFIQFIGRSGLVGNNTADGGAGNDIFLLRSGGGVVTGGSGLDEIWLSLESLSTTFGGAHITDFTAGEDTLDTQDLRAAIGRGGPEFPEDLFEFNILRFQQQGHDGVLQYNRTFYDTGETTPDLSTYPWQDLAVLEGVNLWEIAAGPHAGQMLTRGYGGTPDTSLASLAIRANTLGTAADEAWSGNRWRDTLNGAGGNDTLDGYAANDILIGGSGNDLLRGGWGADDLRGDSGEDTLRGGTGNDTLSGLDDSDVLTGATGADTFSFRTSLLAGSSDLITDFAGGEDRISVLRSLTDVAAAGTLADAHFRAGPQALDADDRFVYDITSGAFYYDSDGNGAALQVKFAQLDDGGTVLAATDILLA